MLKRTRLFGGAVLILFTVGAQAGLTAVAGMPQQPPAKPNPAAVVAAPQKETGPDTTTASFGDWMLRCQAVSGQPGKRSCELVQSIVLQGQTAPIAQLAFGRVTPNEPVYLTAVLPTNVSFPSLVRVSIDEKDDRPVDIAWKRCLPAGCFANLAMTDAILARWRGQDGAGRLAFKNGTGQDVVLPISFRGLARALDALAKEDPGQTR